MPPEMRRPWRGDVGVALDLSHSLLEQGRFADSAAPHYLGKKPAFAFEHPLQFRKLLLSTVEFPVRPANVFRGHMLIKPSFVYGSGNFAESNPLQYPKQSHGRKLCPNLLIESVYFVAACF